MWRIPRCWPDRDVVCIASGPSVNAELVQQLLTFKGNIIAVNDAYTLCGFADVLYGCDFKWWKAHNGVPSFNGLKIGMDTTGARMPAVKYIKMAVDCTGHELRKGLSDNPEALATGGNSGYQAINLAVLMGAKRILLLGYDCKKAPDGKRHFFGKHPPDLEIESNYKFFIESFCSLPQELEWAGVEVINCNTDSAIECFKKMTLKEALKHVAKNKRPVVG